MFQLVYVSSAREEFSDEDLLQLLNSARRNNSARSITGMLLYADGNFIQALEGERAEVEAIYEIIESDPRHNNPMILLQHEIEGRSFSEWSMGFQHLAPEQFSDVEGYSEFLHRNLDLPKGKNLVPAAIRLLFSFKSQLVLNGRNQSIDS